MTIGRAFVLLHIILTIAGLAPEYGGPSRSVPAFAEALVRQNMTVQLLACESEPRHSTPILPDAKLVETRLLPLRSRRGRWFAARNDFYRFLSRTSHVDDTVMHDNGLWLPTNHAVACAARHLKCPLVISVRGMLTKWAARHRGWKKRIAWLLFQRRDLFGASALHATSGQEGQDLRNAGFRGPIAVVPNGIDLPPIASKLSTLNLQSRSIHTALCVARLHPVKGLMSLIEAWATLRPPGWRVVIAGNDVEGHEAELKTAVAAHGLNGAFEFVGQIEGEQKWTLYRTADLFVLPSHSENFGLSIAEALGSGVPVITTRGTPWEDLMRHRCGWWEQVGAAPLTRALREAIMLSDDERRAMGDRGRTLVENKYSWHRVAVQMKSVYEWVLDLDERPSCVQLN